MIIERALREVFSGLKVNDRDVQFNYGTQRELNQWITFRNTNNQPKFPLIWYVSTDYSEFNDTFKVNRARIIVFMNTKYDWLNDKRQVETYEKWIEPTVKEVVKKMKQNLYVTVYGKNDYERFKYNDVRNYGVATDTKNQLESNSFNSSQPKSTKSITTDIVDATVIDFNLEIKPNCIIKK